MQFKAERVEKLSCSKCDQEIDPKSVKPLSSIKCPKCGHAVLAPALMDHFLLKQLLGQGSSGLVFEAFDQQLHRPVAIKLLRHDSDKQEQIALLCINEARALAAVNHPGIVQIYSIGQYRDHHYICMELVTSGRADQYLGQANYLDEAQVLEMGIAVAGGLQVAHKAGLVHMDIKPGNILLAKGHKAKLIDFGAAQYAQLDKTDQGESDQPIIGTPYYIAPEVVSGQTPDDKADMYSLGATLFHLLANRPPFEGKKVTEVMKQRLDKPAPWLSDIRTDIHPETALVISRLLECKPTDRYDDYAQVIDALDAALAAVKLGPVDETETSLSHLAGRPEPGEDFSLAISQKKEMAEATETSTHAKRRSSSIDRSPHHKPSSSSSAWIVWVAVGLFLVGGGIALAMVLLPDGLSKSSAINQPPTVVPGAYQITSVADAGAVVGVITASDSDSDESLHFELQTDKPLPFEVDQQGRLVVIKPLMLKELEGQSVDVTVKVSDSGEPPLSAIVTVPISVLPPDPLTYGLVANWSLDGDATDQSPNRLNGTLVNQPMFSRGKVGYQAVMFNGHNHVQISDDPKLNFADDMTLTFWLRLPPMKQKPGAGIVAKGSDSWRVVFDKSVTGELRFQVDPGDIHVTTINAKLNDNQWHHIVAVKQGTKLLIYVDGEINQSEANGPEKITTTDHSVWIGGCAGQSKDDAKMFVGDIDDVRLYNRALEKRELKTIIELN